MTEDSLRDFLNCPNIREILDRDMVEKDKLIQKIIDFDKTTLDDYQTLIDNNIDCSINNQINKDNDSYKDQFNSQKYVGIITINIHNPNIDSFCIYPSIDTILNIIYYQVRISTPENSHKKYYINYGFEPCIRYSLEIGNFIVINHSKIQGNIDMFKNFEYLHDIILIIKHLNSFSIKKA